jgi:hypothetical protein
MSGEISESGNVTQTASPPIEGASTPGRPQKQLEIEETDFSDDNVIYPTGPKLWLTMGSMSIALFLHGLVRFPGKLLGSGSDID